MYPGRCFDGEEWVTYTDEDGLAAEYYRAIAVEPDGSVWLGTHHRIWRFDGSAWVSVSRNGTDVEHFEGISSMAVAPDGTLWIGGNYGYYKNIWLSHFDGTTWTTFTEDDGLLSGAVESISITPDGSVWVSTDFGLSRPEPQGVSFYDGEMWTVYTAQDHPALERTHSVSAAPDGTVWIATWDRGVLHFDGQNWTQFTTEDGLAFDIVTSVAVAPDSTVWMGTLGGVSRYIPPRQ